MINAIVLDLDGTLLNSNKEVSHNNMKAIQSCHNRNIKIMIATARPPRAVKSLLPPQLLKICSFIYYNGSYIEDQMNQLEYHFSIDSVVTSEIIDYVLAEDPSVQISIESMDRWYSHQNIDYLSFGVSSGPEYLDIEKIKNLSTTKILISKYANTTKLKDIYGEKANIIVTDNGSLIQIMALEGSKENAVRTLCQEYNIGTSSIVAFGDDFNDVGLFHECGYSVAMGNAIQELKDVATMVTDSNDNDGVAKALEWFLNEGISKMADRTKRILL